MNAVSNKRNYRIWGTEKPNFYLEKPMHGKEITVWATLNASRVIGPYFFEDKEDDVSSVDILIYSGENM